MTASGSYPLIDKAVTRLVRRLWDIIIAIAHRHELTRLAKRDDRMLADVGLSRSDLYDARSTPFWVDPTAVLQQCVRHRRHK
jgi:uncharacterized protein YjiS (DUF1127 family)